MVQHIPNPRSLLWAGRREGGTLEEEAMEKGWPGHRGNLSPSATCGVLLWQCLLMWQVAGAGRDGKDDGAGAQRRLKQLCEPSSARTSLVQTSLCFSFIPPSLVSELGGTGARSGEGGMWRGEGTAGPGQALGERSLLSP